LLRTIRLNQEGGGGPQGNTQEKKVQGLVISWGIGFSCSSVELRTVKCKSRRKEARSEARTGLGRSPGSRNWIRTYMGEKEKGSGKRGIGSSQGERGGRAPPGVSTYGTNRKKKSKDLCWSEGALGLSWLKKKFLNA